MRKTLLLTMALLAWQGAPAWSLEQGKVVVTPVYATSQTAAGQPLVLPQQNAEVAASIFDIPPGATLPIHRHPFPRYAYVLAGTLTVTNVESGQRTVYKAGDFIVEMVDLWHQGTNAGTEPVKLLVIDQVEKGKPATILKD